MKLKNLICEASNKFDVSRLDNFAQSYRTLADGLQSGKKELIKIQKMLKRGGMIPGTSGKEVDTSYNIVPTTDRDAGYAFGMGIPFVLKDDRGKNVTMTYTESWVQGQVKRAKYLKLLINPNYNGTYIVITGRKK